MIDVRIGDTRLQIHALALLFVPLFAAFCGSPLAIALCVSLFIHESAHMAAAKLSGVRVDGLKLTPFGGSMRLGNPYLIAPMKLFGIAAAGPLSNLGMVTLCAAMAHWGMLSPLSAVSLMRVNLSLMLFNLLPALPLDGGRMLFALAHRRVGRTRAVRIGIWLGRTLAVLLAILSLLGIRYTGKFNLSPLIAAIFIIASEQDERSALLNARTASILSLLGAKQPIMPASVYAVDSSAPLLDVMRCFKPGTASLFAVYREGIYVGHTDEARVLATMTDNQNGTISDAVSCPPHHSARTVA